MTITEQQNKEIEHICLRAFESVDCPVKQANVVKKRVWLKKQIVEFIEQLPALPQTFEPHTEYK
jgi:hypothetical protein